MNKQGHFGLFETVALITLVIMSKILYTSIPVVVKSTGTASWYEALISCSVTIIFFLIIYQLIKRFPGMDIVEIYEAVLGKVIGKALGFLFTCYVFYYAATSIREFLVMIKSYVLPNTKESIIYISFIGVIVLIVYKGLESLARLSYISFFPILGGLILILIMAYPYYNPDYIKPYMGYGLKNTITTGVLRSSAYQEVLNLFIIIKSIHDRGNVLKAGLISLVISGIMFSVSLLLYVMMFTYLVGSENLSGIFAMSKAIYFSRYFQRVETIFLFPWVVSSLITSAAACYSALYLYCTTFEINNYKPLILPFSFLIYVLAAMPKNVIEFMQVNLAFVRMYSMVFIYGIPILALLVAVITGKRGEKLSAKEN